MSKVTKCRNGDSCKFFKENKCRYSHDEPKYVDVSVEKAIDTYEKTTDQYQTDFTEYFQNFLLRK